MKIVHPFNNPEITSFPEFAALFTIFGGNFDNRIKKWFIHNYIGLQCRFSYDQRVILFDDEFGENSIMNCPIIDRHELRREYVNKWDGIIPYLKDQIIHGYYVYIILDRFYNINFMEFYHKEHYNHFSLVNGFDDDANVFYVADFYGRYSCKTICYSDLEKGFLSYDFDKELNGYDNIVSVKYNRGINNRDTIHYFRPQNICFLLNEYLSGRKCNNIWFGKYVYDAAFDSVTNNERDVRISHVIYDHKKAMNMRVKYLKDLGYINFTSSEMGLFEQLEQKGLLCRNQSIKLILMPKIEYKDKVIKGYHELSELENICINILLEKLLSVC